MTGSPRASTSDTLLRRVRDPADREAWDRFFELYAPLLEGYARAHGLGHADAEEVRDQCLAVVASKMPRFDYRRGQSFKGWLHAIVRGKVIDHLRRPRERQPETAELDRLSDPGPSPDERWERSWRREHLRYGLSEVRRQERPAVFQVFEMLLVEGLPAAEVCRRTGWNANQVYKAKSRVLRRLREVLERLGAEHGPPPDPGP